MINNDVIKRIDELKDDISFHLSKMIKVPDYADWSISSISHANIRLAWFSYIQNNIIQTKLYFSNAGYVDIFGVENYHGSHSRFLDVDGTRCLLPVLSDNEEMIQRYAKLRYKTKYIDGRTNKWKDLTMDEMVLDGEGALFCNTIQFFMENNNEGVERNLNIFELKPKKTYKKSKTLELDYEFYKALYAENKGKIEELLEKMTSPKSKFHKKRNDDPVISQYISMPALGYAKLAWRKGIEVEVRSKLIPKELLPIQPNEHYDIPYDFLK